MSSGVFFYRQQQFFTITSTFREHSPAKIEVTYFGVLHPKLTLPEV
jgi:hypothetical protein